MYSGHAHDLDVTTDDPGNHSHTIPYTEYTKLEHRHLIDLGHTHEVNIDHTHTTPAHTHDQGIVLGNTPTSITLYCDNGAGYDAGLALATAPDLTTEYDLIDSLSVNSNGYVTDNDGDADDHELDITAKFTSAGWKKIKFDTAASGRPGRVRFDLFIDLNVTNNR
jgi:hypothetical protein